MKIQTFFKAAALASLLVSPAGAQQAITRVDGADGTSFFLVTRSGTLRTRCRSVLRRFASRNARRKPDRLPDGLPRQKRRAPAQQPPAQGLLDGAIGAPGAAAIEDLEKARKALAGNPDANNGSLQKIRDGNNPAAIALLQQALSWLGKAQADGADVATLIPLLEQVVESLSAR